MPESDSRPRPATNKRGGYSGGRPAETMGPPANIPSGSVPPAKTEAEADARPK